MSWYNESYRHYLASKGVNTIKYKKAPAGAKYEQYGIDSKGRRVRLYSKAHNEATAKSKFGRISKLERKYPEILKRVEKDAESVDPSTRENARATLVIMKTGLRPGSDKDTQADVQAYGVTTLKGDQVSVAKDKVHFKFIGKKGVKIDKSIKDASVARIVREQKAESKNLFPAISDVTLRQYVGKFGKYKPKDFRTFYANSLAKRLKKQGKDKKEIVAKIAYELQNTPSVSQRAYIAPEVLE